MGKKALMIELLHIDCMTYMATLPDKAFDLAIVDPPYGLDIASMNMGTGKSPKFSSIKNRKWSKNDWDKDAPDINYFNELRRISINQIIWGGNYFDLGSCRHYIIWDKEIPLGMSFADCEFAWTSFNKAPRIFRYSAYLNKSEKTHPTQKPPELYKWLLKNYANPTQRIIDTHLGSGSSAIAAYDFGCDFVGCEIDKEYYDAALKRFETHKMQQVLKFS
jgi:site-specific DNA-methyltransferase (adenine-specific)